VKIARITGFGCYVPDKVLTNQDLEQMVDTNDEWIVSRTGIQERHISSQEQASSDLALISATNALNDAGLCADDIDLIVVGTTSPDMLFPSTGCILQAKLGVPTTAVCLDVSAACSGMMYALEVANNMLRAGAYRKALVVGVDTLTKFSDFTDRNTCILFGDGAATFVLEMDTDKDGFDVVGLKLSSDGNCADLLKIPGCGSRNPASQDVIDKRLQYITMDGQAVYKHAVNSMSGISKAVLEESGLGLDDISLLIPHQANIRIIKSVGKKLKLSSDKVFINLEKYGNTSSASVGIALREAFDTNRIKHGDNIVMTTFGAGFTTAGGVLRYIKN